MINYVLRPGFVIKAPVAVVGARIEELKKRNATPENLKGFVTEEEILEDARPEGSPLHPCITWDLEEAARKQQLREAYDLKRCYDVHFEQPNMEPIILSPANVQIRTPEGRRIGVSTDYAMSQDEYRAQVIKQTITLLDGIQERLRKLRGISPVIIEAIAELKEMMERDAALKPKKTRKQPKATANT